MQRFFVIALVASCHWYPEGELRGDIPLVVINLTTRAVASTQFGPADGNGPKTGHSLDGRIDPGGRHEFLLKPGRILVELDGVATTVVDLKGPTELVVTNAAAPPPASGFRQVTVAQQLAAPQSPGGGNRNDDPQDCTQHPCPAGLWCNMNSGPPDANGYRAPRCGASQGGH